MLRPYICIKQVLDIEGYSVELLRFFSFVSQNGRFFRLNNKRQL